MVDFYDAGPIHRCDLQTRSDKEKAVKYLGVAVFSSLILAILFINIYKMGYDNGFDAANEKRVAILKAMKGAK